MMGIERYDLELAVAADYEFGRRGDWILTYPCRRKFWPLSPRPGDFDIRDIAHHLAIMSRYGGAVRCPFPIGQHCVMGAQTLTDPRLRYEFLMHDAAEAYPPGDILRPLKRSDDPGVHYLVKIQTNIETALRQQFALPIHESAAIKDVDRRMLITETRDLRDGFHRDEYWQPTRLAPFEFTIVAWPWQKAEWEFGRMFVRCREALGMTSPVGFWA